MDMHMLSHQVGASALADQRQLECVRQENARPRKEASAFRLSLGLALWGKDIACGELRRRLTAVRPAASPMPPAFASRMLARGWASPVYLSSHRASAVLPAVRPYSTVRRQRLRR